MSDKQWVLDVSMYAGDGLFCFCPMDADGAVVTDMNILASKSPGPLVAVIHADGQDAAEKWAAENEELLERIK